jgi:hypothetical protein
MAMLSFCGIDVSKDRLDVTVLPGAQSFAVRNDTAGLGRADNTTHGGNRTVCLQPVWIGCRKSAEQDVDKMHAGTLVAALSVAWIAAVGQALFERREERQLRGVHRCVSSKTFSQGARACGEARGVGLGFPPRVLPKDAPAAVRAGSDQL